VASLSRVPKDADHRLRFHDLRHTAAAIWIDLRCSRKQLQAFLGDCRAIERYEHLFEGHEQVLMERMDAALAENLGSVWGPSADSTSPPRPISAV
jgi:integrase